MTTSISSEALLPFVAWPTDNGQNICRIDAYRVASLLKLIMLNNIRIKL